MKKKNESGLAIASLVTGILSVILLFIPIIPQLLAVAAIITGIIGIKKKQGVMAIIGLVLGSLSIVMTILVIVALFAFFAVPHSEIVVVNTTPAN